MERFDPRAIVLASLLFAQLPLSPVLAQPPVTQFRGLSQLQVIWSGKRYSIPQLRATGY